MLPTKRSAIALARGARAGVLITSTAMAEDGVEGGGELSLRRAYAEHDAAIAR